MACMGIMHDGLRERMAGKGRTEKEMEWEERWRS